jgi:hypothetical protein
MKTCTKCKIEKPFEAFYKRKDTKDGYLSECKECQKARKKELKKSPLMQLEEQIRSSIKLENKLLSREGKRLCSKCKNIFLIDDLKGNRCKNCKIEDKKEYYEKNKEHYREYNRQYHLKKKLEKENKIDPKAISAFMEELINTKE